MALTTSSWSRPIQGVSQQPPKVRLEGQCTTQDNANSSVINGLTKRLGTISQKKISEGMPENTQFYYYNRGTDEVYFVAIPPNSLPRVFDSFGDELTVENDHPYPEYIKAGNPDRDISISTISDYTFLANGNVLPEKRSEKTPSINKMAILNLQFADYGRKYKVYIDGDLKAGFETPDGKNSEDIKEVSTTFLIRILYDGDPNGDSIGTFFGTALKDLPDFDIEINRNTLLVSRKDGGDFKAETSDAADGKDFIAIKGKVSTVGDLPRRAPEGFLVEIVGSGNTDDENYWLRADSSSEGDTVVWKEDLGPEQSLGFDETTMPAVLIRDRFESGKAVFKFDVAPWKDRSVGTDETNPFPSFIQDGKAIKSIGTFQNRLYFTAGESVIYSRSNYFFDFFRETIRTALDDEPIDVLADTNRVNNLHRSIVLDGDLVFFSPNGQFIQYGDKPLTKDNAALRYASNFENLEGCNPAPGGDVVFFAFEYGRYSGVREFYTDSLTDTKKARPVTDHVDQYIEGRSTLMATSTNQSQMLVLAGDRHIVYVYEWLWQGNERAQSSWSRWVFDGWVRHVAYDRDNIYLIIERENGLMLEYIKTGDPADPGLDFACRIDQRSTVKATFDKGLWFFEGDPNIPKGETLVVQGKDCVSPGVTIEVEDDDSLRSMYTKENLSDVNDEVTLIMGRRYTMVYEPTMPFIKDKSGSVIETDRLTINDININYNKTGLTFIYVENDYGVKRDYSFNGRDVGGSGNLVGFAPIRPGQYTFPLRQESDRAVFRLETSSHVPFELRDMEWRGRFHQRGRRV